MKTRTQWYIFRNFGVLMHFQCVAKELIFFFDEADNIAHTEMSDEAKKRFWVS